MERLARQLIARKRDEQCDAHRAAIGVRVSNGKVTHRRRVIAAVIRTGTVWTPDKTQTIKVRLHDNGEDVETPWAEDLGEAVNGARLVRLGNVPFLHAKPTYEDELLMSPDPDDGVLTWDVAGRDYGEVCAALHRDSGRWVAIVDYRPRTAVGDVDSAFRELDLAGEDVGVAVEGAFVEEDRNSGRAYLAVPATQSLEALESWLGTLDFLVYQMVHPVDDE